MSLAAGIGICLIALAILWLIGDGVAKLLGAHEQLPPGGRGLLGLAVALLFIDALTLFFPVRWTIWSLVPLTAWGAVTSFRRWRARETRPTLASRWRSLAPPLAALTGAFVAGAWPLLVARRVAVTALSNDDSTFYIDAADHVLRVPWLVQLPEPDGCLSNIILHGWHWRMGVPLLVAALSAATRTSSVITMALVPPLLHVFVPVGAWWLMDALEVKRTARTTWIVGLGSALSASAIFVTCQDMTSHQGSLAVFPAAVASMALAARHGGVRRLALAGVLLGLAVLLFADGASVLVLLTFAVALSLWRTPAATARRLAAVWSLGAAFAAPSFVRAALALYGTLAIRFRAPEKVFPTRGWLPRSPVDDVGTLLGIDPWPPWPAPWPLDRLGIASLVGIGGALALLLLAARELRNSPLARSMAACIGLSLLAARISGSGTYILVKALISSSAFVVPCIALGASLPRWKLSIVPAVMYAAGLFAALSFLAVPTRFQVIDGILPIEIANMLRQVPRGSVVMLDGFGSPADPVHDTQRIFRAALRQAHVPIRLGQDGGFYTLCPAPGRIEEDLPAYAVQRVSSETLSTGVERGRFGLFRLIEARLDRANQFVAAWAPTVGWLPAEKEPDGTVFRWGEHDARGMLRAYTRAPCIRVRGEVRTRVGGGRLAVNLFDLPVASAPLSTSWTPFESLPVSTPLVGQTMLFDARPDDAAPRGDHVFALRRLAIVPDAGCATFRAEDEAGAAVMYPLRLRTTRAFSFEAAPTLHCARVAAMVSHGSGRLGARAGGDVAMTWAAVGPGTTTLRSNVIHLAQPHRLEVARETSADPEDWRIESMQLEDAPCPTDLDRADAATDALPGP